ncbi:MAG: class I SAM-dependent methyltransferase, partial [Rhizobiaceae bacterium]|nr:class I SAM-dependent methyltransferase [Rhizobiaceae bacterium]
CRMWEFYLAGSEVAFRHQHLVVLQIQLARRIDTLPLTRAYIAREEARLAGLDRLDGGAHRMAGE